MPERKMPTSNPPQGDFTKKDLLTPTERKFYEALIEAFGNYHTISIKTRLCDIVKNINTNDFNRISAKHVDFVLCYRDTLKVRCVIELDDASHQAPVNQAHDAVKSYFLNKAGIPVIRYPVYKEYFISTLRKKIETAKADPDATYPVFSENTSVTGQETRENHDPDKTEKKSEPADNAKIQAKYITWMIITAMIAVTIIVVYFMHTLTKVFR